MKKSRLLHVLLLAKPPLSASALVASLAFAALMGASHASCAQEESAGMSWWSVNPWTDPERGFNWYPPDTPARPAPEVTPLRDLRSITALPALRAEVDRRRDLAIMNPTNENMTAYLEANKFVMDKSSVFTDVWRRVVWGNAALDYNARSPQANFAQLAMKENRTANENAIMSRLATTHGILFFFRGGCEYCHMQAPVLKMLSQRYKIDVLAVSIDNTPIAEFPNARPDNGISLTVSNGRGIEIVPSLYLVSRDKSEVIPLGAGVLAVDEIVDRVRILTTTRPGDNF